MCGHPRTSRAPGAARRWLALVAGGVLCAGASWALWAPVGERTLVDMVSELTDSADDPFVERRAELDERREQQRPPLELIDLSQVALHLDHRGFEAIEDPELGPFRSDQTDRIYDDEAAIVGLQAQLELLGFTDGYQTVHTDGERVVVEVLYQFDTEAGARRWLDLVRIGYELNHNAEDLPWLEADDAFAFTYEDQSYADGPAVAVAEFQLRRGNWVSMVQLLRFDEGSADLDLLEALLDERRTQP